MSAAEVIMRENDLTTRVPSFPGVFIAVAIKAKKGDTTKFTLVTKESQLLTRYTANGKIEVGSDIAFYSALTALQKTDKVWVRRVANDAMYGGYKYHMNGTTTQLNQLTEEKQRLNFSTSNLIEGTNTISISNIVDENNIPMDPTDLIGRDIVIEGVGTYQVIDLVDGIAELSSSIVAPTQLPSIAQVVISASPDYVTLDVTDIVADSDLVTIANLSNSGTADSLVGKVIHLSTLGDFTINSVSGDVATLNTPITGTDLPLSDSGYTGYPESTVNLSGIADGSDKVIVDTILVGDVNDSLLNRTITIDSVLYTIDLVTGNELTLDAKVNNNSLVDTADGYAPYVPLTADSVVDPSAIPMDESDAFIIHGSSEGEWFKNIRCKFTSYDSEPDRVKEPGAMILEVFTSDNLVVPKEVHLVSRVPGTKDGYGNNIYIEDKLQSSNYVRAINGYAVDFNILPNSSVDFCYAVNGDDGDPITDSNMVKAVESLYNTNGYPVTLLLDGGHATPGYAKELIKISEARQDCVALLSCPMSAESTVDYATAIVDYRKNILNANTSYAALYSSYQQVVDKYNNRSIFIAPDGFAASAISYSASNYRIWYPPAGFKRGSLNVVDSKIRFTKGEMDYLYDNGINPIRFYPGKGINIWGQKTLLSRPSSLDRLNVRLLLIVIKPAIAEALESFLFEINDPSTRALVTFMIKSYMESVKSNKGVYDFKVICDDSNNSGDDIDNHIMNVDLFIKPTQSTEYIPFTTIITRTGMDFKLAQEAN
jgi:hypothetical protein